MTSRTLDLTGQRFGRLAVVGFADLVKERARWRCRCACGVEKVIRAASLRNGDALSCGCLRREKAAAIGLRTKTHGQSRTRTYRSWCHMKARCANPAHKEYPHYGGRGIMVCERWLHSFEAFLADMGERPAGLTIERLNVDRGYEPGNCTWADDTAQGRNTRRVRLDVATVSTVKERLRRGDRHATIAADAGVSVWAIRNIRYGRSWSTVA